MYIQLSLQPECVNSQSLQNVGFAPASSTGAGEELRVHAWDELCVGYTLAEFSEWYKDEGFANKVWNEAVKVVNSDGDLIQIKIALGPVAHWCCAQRVCTESAYFEAKLNRWRRSNNFLVDVKLTGIDISVAARILEYLRYDTAWWESVHVTCGALDLAAYLRMDRLLNNVVCPRAWQKWAETREAKECPDASLGK